MPTRPIRLIPLESRGPAQRVLDVAPEGELIACDFHVLGIERAEVLPWGYRKGRILNIDHHAPSSSVLSQRFVEAPRGSMRRCG